MVFIGLAIYGSLVPLRYTPIDFDLAAQRFQRLQYLQLGIQSRSDWVANILLFIPVGFLLSASCLVDRAGAVRKVVVVPGVLAVCAALSIAIEFTQLWFPPRTVSQNDIIAESIGGAIGTMLWVCLGARLTRSVRAFLGMTRPADQLEWLLRAYLAGLLVYSVLPFDVTIRPAELWDKYQEGKITLVPFSYSYGSPFRAIYAMVATVLTFVPVGMLIARSGATGGTGARSVATRALWGLALAAGVEALQLFVYSRTTNTTDVITGTFGALLGAWIMGRRIPDAESSAPTERRSHVCLLYLGLALLSAALLPVVFWAPYDFITDGALIRDRAKGLFRAPFSALYFGNDFNAMVQMTRKTLWYVPLGALLTAAVRTSGLSSFVRRCMLSAILPLVFILAVAIELGKVLVPSRTPDFTNVLLASLGGLAGIFLARRMVQAVEQPEPPLSAARSTEPPDVGHFYIPGLDGLRAIACLAVFGVHFHQLTGMTGSSGPFDLSRFLINGNHGVALFFVMSGFLLGLPWWFGGEPSANVAWLRSYGFKRIARIAPPYLLCLTILVLKGRHWETAVERLDTLVHYLFLHNYAEFSIYSLNSPFWTLAVQAQFYVIFPIALLLVHRAARSRESRLWLWLALLAGSFAAHDVVMTLSGNPDGYVLSHSLLAHLPHFFMGVSAGYVFWRLSLRSGKEAQEFRVPCELVFWASALVVLLVVATPLDELAQVPFGRYHFPLVPCLIALMVACVGYTRGAKAILESAPLRLLGVISFGVYIYHLPCLNLVSRVMTLAGKDPAANWALFAALGLVVSIGVAAVSYAFVERPLLRVSRGYGAGRTHASAEAVGPTQLATTF